MGSAAPLPRRSQRPPTSCGDQRKGAETMATTSRMEKRSFNAPDETRPAGTAQAQIVTINGVTFMQVTAQPGWRWAHDVKPIVKTDSCQAPHTGLVIAGRVRVKMDDGSEEEFGPGDLY